MRFQSPGWGRRRSVCWSSGLSGGLHHLLLHLPSLSGEPTLLSLSVCLSILTPDYHFTFFSRPFSLTFVVHVDSVCLHSESVPFQTVQAPPTGQSPAPIGSRTCHSQCESLVVFDGVFLCEKRWSSSARLHLSSFVFITAFSITWPLESLQLASSRVCIPVASVCCGSLLLVET